MYGPGKRRNEDFPANGENKYRNAVLSLSPPCFSNLGPVVEQKRGKQENYRREGIQKDKSRSASYPYVWLETVIRHMQPAGHGNVQ